MRTPRPNRNRNRNLDLDLDLIPERDAHFHSRAQVTLTLGGSGGLRALCHLGVLAAYERAEIPLRLLVGAGSGAIPAAAYALQPDAARLREIAVSTLLSKTFRASPLLRTLVAQERRPSSYFGSLLRTMRRFLHLGSLSASRSLLASDVLEKLIAAFVPDAGTFPTAIGLRLVALDLISGRELVMRQGDLRRAVLASASMASFFPPVEWNGALLVNPGPMITAPVTAARRESPAGDVVVAVDASGPPPPREQYNCAVDVVLRVHQACAGLLNEQLLDHADLVLRPATPDEGPASLGADWVEALIDAGRRAAEQSLGTLWRQLLSGFDRVLADVACRRDFIAREKLDACVRETLRGPGTTLHEVFLRRGVVAPQLLGVMMELVQRKLAAERLGTAAGRNGKASVTRQAPAEPQRAGLEQTHAKQQ